MHTTVVRKPFRACLFKYETIETHAHTFLSLIISAVGSVYSLDNCHFMFDYLNLNIETRENIYSGPKRPFLAAKKRLKNFGDMSRLSVTFFSF